MWMIAVFMNSKNGNTIQAIEDYDGCVATKYHRKEETGSDREEERKFYPGKTAEEMILGED